MALIRCRQSNCGLSYQAIETFRRDGKVKQRVLANLGHYPTVEEALEATRHSVGLWESIVYRADLPGRKFHRTSPNTKARYEKRLEKERLKLERLEVVVSELSRRRDTCDTTPDVKPRNYRQSNVRLGEAPHSNFVNRLSGLQAGVLMTLYTKRVPGARGCDASRAELLAQLWEWEPTRPLRWSKEHSSGYPAGHYRVGDPVPSYGFAGYGLFSNIPRKEYRSAQASLSRALGRLHQRGLIKFVSGTVGTYSAGPVLTETGDHAAWLLCTEAAQ